MVQLVEAEYAELVHIVDHWKTSIQKHMLTVDADCWFQSGYGEMSSILHQLMTAADVYSAKSTASLSHLANMIWFIDLIYLNHEEVLDQLKFSYILQHSEEKKQDNLKSYQPSQESYVE